jgi:acetolactate synthase I/II/III large subunit
MAKTKKEPPKKELIDRRKFMKGAAAGGIASLVATTAGIAAPQPALPGAKVPIPAPETDPTGEVAVLTTDRPGADFMVDVLKSIGFEYIAANPGSTFRGLHESIINYGGNKAPELITCCHEESAVAIAHGYAEVEGKPMAVMLHATVGLQHGSMGIFNAWAGQVPIFMLIGNTIDATVPHLMFHAAPDVAAMVRDFTKWDDLPISLQHFAESAVRAYKISMTLPREPVAIVIDTELQEDPVAKDAVLHIPKPSLDTAPQADSASVAEIARLLVNAENPVILAGRVVSSQAGMDNFLAFAEALQAPIADQGENLPSRHPLVQGGRGQIANADVILALQDDTLWSTLHTGRDQLVRTSIQINKPSAKIITINSRDLYARSNFQDLQRLADVDLAVAADPEVTLPALTEAINRLATDDRKRAFQDRGKKLAEASQKAHERARAEAAYGWDSSPISQNRVSAEVWNQVKDEDWAVANGGAVGGDIIDALWKSDKYYQRTTSRSANGVGFRAPSAVGAALAHKKHGRLVVYAQGDGDLMYAPGVLWTAAHHRIPLLAVMHNNRAYHQEVMHIERMSARHQRGIDRAGIGTKLEDPNIDFAKIAQGMGLYAEGPISNPNDLGPAIKRALAVVKKGEPALLDVVVQPR